MPRPARLVATLTAPLPFADAEGAPWLTPWPGGARLLVQRGETELLVRETTAPATAEPVRFPAPWPRRYRDAAVSPTLDLAVFSGPHGLRAVDRTGAVRWELAHGCWAGCEEGEAAAGATGPYSVTPHPVTPNSVTPALVVPHPDDRAHRYAPRGSVEFSVDGTFVWAHVRGPLAGDGPGPGPGPGPGLGPDPDPASTPAPTPGEEEWLVLDAADGTVLARVETGTAAAGSSHVPHPDSARMGLTIGEGQDGSPLRWGHYDGRTLTVDSLGDDDLVLLAVSPGGDRLLTVTHDQETLAVHRLADGAVAAALDASGIPSRGPEDVPEREDSEEDEEPNEAYFDYAGGFVDEDTVIAGTVESDEEHDNLRHWLVGADRMAYAEVVDYPFPIEVPPTALGDGTWYTTSSADNALHLWSL
ncbi:hypothetical protein ABZ990_02535 [Streptomyces sp. NPDC046203]|uniref:hypothetical protein n=1 Tax=Streptomyces sp. NPDC046203 TaxID=3154602 RepID=UPI0033C549A0